MMLIRDAPRGCERLLKFFWGDHKGFLDVVHNGLVDSFLHGRLFNYVISEPKVEGRVLKGDRRMIRQGAGMSTMPGRGE